jgi:peptidoglycan/LPS O-acetylase OafA/YrhL
MEERFTNNFDFLRFFAASLIIFSHGFALYLGYARIFVFYWHLLIGQFGLATLLVISGYLITQSWERKPDIKKFFWKRTLRIIPGMIASILFVILIIGPIATDLNLHEYFSNLLDPSTWTTIPFYTTGAALGLFTTNPVTYVNAPLWTIPFEFLLYLIIASLGMAGVLLRKKSMLPFIFTTALLWALWYENPALNKIRFALYFLIGSYIYINREKMEYKLWLTVILWIPVIIFYNSQLMFLFAFIAVPYTVLYAAHIPSEIVHKFGKYGDFSFGLFIYGYPVQQTIIHLIPDLGIPALIVLSYAFTIPIAVISWHLIEKHALVLKNKIPF